MLLVAAAPAIWLGLDLVGSGSALESSEIAQTSPLGSAARAANPGITVFSRAADAVLLPILLLALLSVPLAYRRRNAPGAHDGRARRSRGSSSSRSWPRAGSPAAAAT